MTRAATLAGWRVRPPGVGVGSGAAEAPESHPRIGRVATPSPSRSRAEPARSPAEGAAELRPAELYRAGQRDEAVAALAGRSEDDRRRELEALRRLKAASDRLGRPDPRVGAPAHRSGPAERGKAAHRQPLRPQRPGGVRAGGGGASWASGRIHGRGFVQRWFTGDGARAASATCAARTSRVVDEGRARLPFPKDASLYLVRGTAAETEGTFAPTLDFVTLDRGDENEQALTRRTRPEARKPGARPGAVDARPRAARGAAPAGPHAVWRLGDRAGRALENLERVARAAQAPELGYLSQLFLARVYDLDGARVADAERAYRAALAAAAPAPRRRLLGLAELQARRDGIAATRPAGDGSAWRTRRGKDARDPYWSYAGAFAGGGERSSRRCGRRCLRETHDRWPWRPACWWRRPAPRAGARLVFETRRRERIRRRLRDAATASRSPGSGRRASRSGTRAPVRPFELVGGSTRRPAACRCWPST